MVHPVLTGATSGGQSSGRTFPPLFHEIIVITVLLFLLSYKWSGEQLVES